MERLMTTTTIPPTRLYVTDIDDTASFVVPSELADAIDKTDEYIETEKVTAYDRGFYYALCEILATPMALLEEKLQALEDEAEESPRQDMFDIGILECTSVFADTPIGNITNEVVARLDMIIKGTAWSNAKDSEVAEEEEEEIIPMTIHELTTWYSDKSVPVIPQWASKTHKEKYQAYLEYLEENADISDEEMLKQLEEFDAEAA